MNILAQARAKGVQVHVPVDVLAADDFSNEAKTLVVDVIKSPVDGQGLDAGPKTLEIFKEVILNSKTILWNGPVGVFEMEKFANGTIVLAITLMKLLEMVHFPLWAGAIP